MQLSTRYGLTGIGALGLLAAVHQLRDVERPPQPISDCLIGVLPNFAAAIAITFVLLSIWSDQNPKASFTSARRRFLLFAAISGIGQFDWELSQKTSGRLVFDPHDVAATIVGVGTAAILFYLIRPPSSNES